MKPPGSFKITPITGKPSDPPSVTPAAESEKTVPFMPRQVDIQWMPIQTRKRGFRPKSPHQEILKIDSPNSRENPKSHD